jgi:hypothetical protein
MSQSIESPSAEEATLSYSTEELLDAAKRHAQFLHDLHRLGVTLQRPSRTSLERYLNCWLPLLETQKDEEARIGKCLIPPPDIAWIWHCDRLFPLDYSKRFKSIIIPKHSAFSFQTESNPHAPTIQAWSQMYSDKPFFWNENDSSERQGDDEALPVHESFLQACTSQSKFYYSIPSPIYLDETFLRAAIHRYELFLKIQSTNDAQQQTMIPTNSIDFLWHTHMGLDTQTYRQDCQRLLQGRILVHELHHHHHHDEKFAARNSSAITTPFAEEEDDEHTLSRKQAWKATLALWHKTYPNIDYLVQGDFSQREPPREYFDEYQTWEWTAIETQHQQDPSRQKTESAAVATAVTTNTFAPCAFVPMKMPPSLSNVTTTRSPFISAASLTPKHQLHSAAMAHPLTPKDCLEEDIFPQRDGYMFGMGPSGLGYYSLEPCIENNCLSDALLILNHRLKQKQHELEASLKGLDCRYFFCGLFGCYPRRVRQERLVVEGSLRELTRMRRTVWKAVQNDAHNDSPRNDTTGQQDSFGKENGTNERTTKMSPDNTVLGSSMLAPEWIDDEFIAAAACGGSTMKVDDDRWREGCGDGDCTNDCCYF